MTTVNASLSHLSCCCVNEEPKVRSLPYWAVGRTLLWSIIVASLVLLFTVQAFAGNKQQVSQAVKIKFSAYVVKFFDINVTDGYVDLKLWVSLNQPQQDPLLINRLEIINSQDFKRLYSNQIRNPDGSYDSTGEFTARVYHPFVLRDFPFDRQHLKIKFEDTISDWGQLQFIPVQLQREDEVVSPDALNLFPGWRLINAQLLSVKHRYATGFSVSSIRHRVTYSQVDLTISIERVGMRLFFSLFATLYLAYFLSLITLLVPARKSFINPRLSLLGGSVFALVGNRLITDRMLQYASQFNLADKLQLTTFLFLLFSLVAVLITSICIDRIKRSTLDRWGYAVAIAYFVIYVFLNILFVMDAMH